MAVSTENSVLAAFIDVAAEWRSCRYAVQRGRYKRLRAPATTLDKHEILNERELHARYEVFLENYNRTINSEAQARRLFRHKLRQGVHAVPQVQQLPLSRFLLPLG